MGYERKLKIIEVDRRKGWFMFSWCHFPFALTKMVKTKHDMSCQVEWPKFSILCKTCFPLCPCRILITKSLKFLVKYLNLLCGLQHESFRTINGYIID